MLFRYAIHMGDRILSKVVQYKTVLPLPGTHVVFDLVRGHDDAGTQPFKVEQLYLHDRDETDVYIVLSTPWSSKWATNVGFKEDNDAFNDWIAQRDAKHRRD